MAIIGVNCDRGYRTFDECVKCPKRCIIIPPILDQLKKSSGGYYKQREHEYHVTSLLGCPRRLVLAHVFGDFTPPDRIWKMSVGVLGHDLMERYPVGEGISEQQVHGNIDVNGTKCKVVGRFDWYNSRDKRLHDYKFVWRMDFIPNEKHYRQMAVYYILGIDSGVFAESDLSGGFEIDYVDVKTGIMHPYQSIGEAFKKHVDTMRNKIPEMLEHYVKAEVEGIIPDGDLSEKECNYCPPEFKYYCPAVGGKDVKDIKSARIAINAYRRDNTPEDD